MKNIEKDIDIVIDNVISFHKNTVVDIATDDGVQFTEINRLKPSRRSRRNT